MRNVSPTDSNPSIPNWESAKESVFCGELSVNSYVEVLLRIGFFGLDLCKFYDYTESYLPNLGELLTSTFR